MSVDVDADPVLADRYAVRAVPTRVVIHQGKTIAQAAGVPQKKAL